MRITALKRRRDRVRIHVDGESEPRAELALDLVSREGLAVGDLIPPGRLAELEAEDESFRAREAALRLLSHRPRSRAELRRRLERNGYTPTTTVSTLTWLEERGYVDDVAFAEAFVRDRIRLRPRGRVGLLRELGRKGVDPVAAEAAIAAAMGEEDVDERGLARDAAEAWARRNRSAVRDARGDDRDRWLRARRRLYAHLARRGFAPDAVSAAVTAVLGD